ncbi:MAG: efflux RND transporter periplasmic adaptor subunit [Candidatus Pacebacteria bacterium]|nr:efflux RND transporter periplasmic adaptor subunit [Candidatus Paceibacterota bacterium]
MNKNTLLITVGIVLVGAGIVGGLLLKNSSNNPYELTTVKRGEMTQEVSASGKVEAPTKIDLHFKNSGKLVEMNAKVGKKVLSGQLMSKQDTAQLDAQVLEMQAGIDLQKAKLQQLISGASQEDINIYETSVLNAEQSLEDARKNVIDKIKNSYTKSDDAIRGKSDQLFTNPRNYNSQLIFVTSDSKLESSIESQRFLLESTLESWSNSLKIISTENDLIYAVELANNNINQVKSFLDDISSVVNSLTVYSNVSQTTIDKWKADIFIARTNIDTVSSNLFTAEESLKTKEGALKSSQSQLALKKIGVRSSDVAVFQAQISQAEASLQKTQAQRRELMIFAPSSGVVTYTNGEVGETVGPDRTIMSIATTGALQIKLNVVEDKIVNVRVGQKSRITFDAIENEEFVGTVVSIDPAETIIGGTVYYLTTILFDNLDERIRSGMTANVWIKTSDSNNSLYVPVSAVQNKDSKKIVQIYNGKEVVEKEVITGIKNDIGMIEIISGISEGEQVIHGNKK